jgi:hypothetical protein
MVTNTQTETATEVWSFTAFSRFRKSFDAETLVDRQCLSLSYLLLKWYFVRYLWPDCSIHMLNIRIDSGLNVIVNRRSNRRPKRWSLASGWIALSGQCANTVYPASTSSVSAVSIDN